MSKQKDDPPREADIIILSQILTNLHHRDEAYWLAQMWNRPASCQSATARVALRRAVGLARECGFPEIADWLESLE